MARTSGRKLAVKRGAGGPPLVYTKIAALRSKTLAFGKDKTDVTTDDDNGYATALAESAERMVSLSFSGITEDEILIAAINAGVEALEEIEIEDEVAGWTITGQFFFGNLTLTGEYQGAITFEGEMTSSGTWTYAAGA